MTVGKKLGKSLGRTLGESLSAKARRQRRRAGELVKRPGSRGPYAGKTSLQMERLEDAACPKETCPGTLPERIVRQWLDERGIVYRAQTSIEGGRLVAGGAVVDFILPTVGQSPGTVVRVNGFYWHSIAERQKKDLAQELRLRAQGFNVVDIPEYPLYGAVINGSLDSFLEDIIFGGKVVPQRDYI